MERTLHDGVHGGDDGADQLGALVPVVLAPHRVHARALQHERHDRHVERRATHIAPHPVTSLQTSQLIYNIITITSYQVHDFKIRLCAPGLAGDALVLTSRSLGPV